MPPESLRRQPRRRKQPSSRWRRRRWCLAVTEHTARVSGEIRASRLDRFGQGLLALFGPLVSDGPIPHGLGTEACRLSAILHQRQKVRNPTEILSHLLTVQTKLIQNHEIHTTSISNYSLFEFFYSKFDHLSYSKILCKHCQI